MYDALLGARWSTLDPAIRRLHERGAVRRAQGVFRVRHGANVLARMAARLGGMPPPAGSVGVVLVVTPQSDGEQWRRMFGTSPLVSTQTIDGDSVIERFGAIEVRFRLDVSDGGLRYLFEGGSIRILGIGIPLPLAASAYERAREEGGIDVSVDVAMRPIGRIVAYDGRLTRVEVDR